MTNTNKATTKVTIYVAKEFGMGIRAIEAKLVEHGTRKYAQYNDAPFAVFVPKRARKARTIVQGYKPTMLIVKGWNQPQPDAAFLPAEQQGELLVSRGRYSRFDSRWESDFNAMIDASGVEIIADYRGHNSHG